MSAVVEPTLPPQDIDAEESVLGAMMLSELAVETATEVIRDPRDFYREGHATIFRAMIDLSLASQPIDAVTVADRLAAMGKLEEVGGRAYIHGLVDATPAAANVRRYAEIVHEHGVLRRLIQAGSEIVQAAYDRGGTARELIERAEEAVFRVGQERQAGDLVELRRLLVEEFEKIEALGESGGGITGTPSGLRDLDRITSGFQPSNLIILAARPAMGKTSLALGMARHVGVEARRPVAIFSLEMSRSEIAQRLMCAEGRVDSHRLRTGNMKAEDWARLTTACDRLSQAPVYIDDTAGITLMEIRSKARRLKAREPALGLVVIDYLQLMSSAERVESRVQEISQISRGLKVMARELDVPVIALSQLSRAVEARAEKRPVLSDLRESGSIEQDADIVMFLSREELYVTPEQWAQQHPDLPESAYPKGVAQVSVAKHRNGPTGSVELRFRERLAKFEDWVLRTDDLPD